MNIEKKRELVDEVIKRTVNAYHEDDSPYPIYICDNFGNILGYLETPPNKRGNQFDFIVQVLPEFGQQYDEWEASSQLEDVNYSPQIGWWPDEDENSRMSFLYELKRRLQ